MLFLIWHTHLYLIPIISVYFKFELSDSYYINRFQVMIRH